MVPKEVLEAMAKPVIHHRTPEFKALFEDCTKRMQKVFKTENELFILAGSGTSAMDAAIANTIEKGDKVLSIVSGKFSERMRDIAKAYNANVTELSFDWGAPVDIEKVKEALTEDTKLITIVHNETSTGVRNPVKELAGLTKDTNTLLAVDAISSMGGDTIETDKWGLDFCISGSQKVLAMATGLAFISVSEKAWETIEKTNSTKYYLDLQKYRKMYPTQTPFSTPVTYIYGLRAALDLLEKEGLENRIKRYTKLAEKTRAGVKKMGFKLLPQTDEICSNTLTAVYSEQASDIKKQLNEKYDILVAGGQAHLKDKIFRIAHMGIITEEHIDKTLNAIGEIIK